MDIPDYNNDLHEIIYSSTNPQTKLTTTTTTSVGINQQSRDFSDWRNIQLAMNPSPFDPFWNLPTVNSLLNASTSYSSQYNPQTYPWNNNDNNNNNNNNNNNFWPMTNFQTNSNQTRINYNPSKPNFTPTEPPVHDIIDLTINNTVNSTVFNGQDFTPAQVHPFAEPTMNMQQYLDVVTPLTQDTALPLANNNPEQSVNDPELILVPEVDIEEILTHVEVVIPDIDIDAARRTITAMDPIPSIDNIVTQFLDNGYTKKQKRSADQQRNMSFKRSWSETMDDIPKFLSIYSDPIKYFFDTKRKQSELYINHAKAYLLRAFPTVDKTILEECLQEENFHFLPTIRKLERKLNIRTNSFLQRSTIRRSLDMLDLSIGGVSRTPSTSWLIKNNKFSYAIPHTPCEEFYDELRFAKNEVKIRRHLGKTTKEYEKRVKKAKKGNETLECEICYHDDLLIEDMVECTAGHLYCRNCVRTHIDVCFKEGKCRFVCVENSCPGEYTTRLIGELLSSKDFERLNRRIQEDNIRQAEIEGLECCPYCPYAVIVENPNDKVFRCLNPECLKETCRLCKEPNHIPLRCDEVEKGVELEMRKFIEEHVSEAMIRKCPRCTQRFYKVEGCNKMTCSSCGLFICYVCRETITGYDHFTNNERCTLSNQSEKLHYEEMVQAYKNAKDEYLRLHPEAHDLVLRYDPMSHLATPSVSSTSTHQ